MRVPRQSIASEGFAAISLCKIYARRAGKNNIEEGSIKTTHLASRRIELPLRGWLKPVKKSKDALWQPQSQVA
jgi:hypothetical protein